VRYVLENIEARKVPSEMERRGISPSQRVRVVVELLEDEISLAKMAVEGGAFDFLRDESDLYTEADLRR
jgi:hypothetical protein